MSKQKFIPDPILMVISILCITAFQLYWLVQNYAREKKSLVIKSEAAFRETFMQLQVAKLNLDGIKWNGKDSSNANLKIVMNTGDNPSEGGQPKAAMITSIDIIRNKFKDTTGTKHDSNHFITVTMDNRSSGRVKDPALFKHSLPRPPLGGDQIFDLLYSIDSLQDSLRLSEIDSAYARALQREKLPVPFSIIKTTGFDALQKPASNEIVVGFAHPVRYQLKLGNTVPFLIRQIFQPILFSIGLLGITALAFVVLYKNLLRQKKLAEEKNEFISNITHELKTPIATVAVAIEALKNFNATDDPQRTIEYLDISQNELQRLGLLVDKVLQLSIFETRQVELKNETIHLEHLVHDVVSSLKLQLENFRAMVTVTHTGDTTVSGDRMHLLSVIFNLLDNALKYSKEAPSIRVDLKGADSSVVLTITDNGIGISPEYHDKVFDKFFRVPHGDTHNAKGYGLGLSYVAQVIQKHGGTISIDSQPGVGTKFTITLPKISAATTA